MSIIDANIRVIDTPHEHERGIGRACDYLRSVNGPRREDWPVLFYVAMQHARTCTRAFLVH